MKYIVTLNGKSYEVEVNETDAVINAVTNAAAPVAPVAPIAAPAAAPSAAPSASGSNVISPMPGTILKVLCQNGQAVKAGDTLFILEAMKMENEIAAEVDGVVKQILVSTGSTVATDDVLAVI